MGRASGEGGRNEAEREARGRVERREGHTQLPPTSVLACIHPLRPLQCCRRSQEPPCSWAASTYLTAHCAQYLPAGIAIPQCLIDMSAAHQTVVHGAMLQWHGAMLQWHGAMLQQWHGAMLQRHGAMLQWHGAMLQQWHGAMLQRHGTMLQWHGGMLQWHGARLQWHGAMLQWHGAMLQWHGAMLQ